MTIRMKKSALILSACVMLAACSESKKEQATPPSVYVTTVGEGSAVAGNSSFSGHVVDDNSVSLGFKTAGQIKRILVHEGQHVAKGQLLAELDNSDYKLGVEAVQSQYDQLAAEVARAKRLYEKKSMTTNDYEKAVAGLHQLGVQLQVNKNKVAYTRLYAPASGIIGSVNFSPAEMVDAGTAVFTLINSSPLEVECDIPASVYNQLKSYSNFTCTPANGGESYPLRVLSVVPKADGNQLYKLRLGFASHPGKDITAGVNVSVNAHCSAESADITVPASAVFLQNGKEAVWVLKSDSTVVARNVGVGEAPVNGQLPVVSGLSAGEKVVSAGVSALHQGERVKVIQQPAKTNVGGLL